MTDETTPKFCTHEEVQKDIWVCPVCKHEARTNARPGNRPCGVRAPGIIRKAVNYVQAQATAAFDLYTKVTPEESAERRRICKTNKCMMYDGTNDTCLKCGCPLAYKPEMRAWDCPLGYWPKPKAIPKPGWLDNATRHLTYHIWPVQKYGVWKWNCDQILKQAEIFNGRRIISVVEGPGCDSADMVREYLRDFPTDFLVFRNNPYLREVVTFVPMLKLLEKYQSEVDVTFTGHAKGVKYIENPFTGGLTVLKWAEAMYETCLNWGAVQPLLETCLTVGTFHRNRDSNQDDWPLWHYSGGMYWWRNKDVFSRKWQDVPRNPFGTEQWPGIMFDRKEAGVLVGDNLLDLYDRHYWETKIEPMLTNWRQQCPT